MAQISESYKKENHFEFICDYTAISFGLGYSYTKSEEYKHLVHITIIFWHLDFAW